MTRFERTITCSAILDASPMNHSSSGFISGEPPVMSMTLNPPVSKAASTASMVSRVMHSSFLGEQDR